MEKEEYLLINGRKYFVCKGDVSETMISEYIAHGLEPVLTVFSNLETFVKTPCIVVKEALSAEAASRIEIAPGTKKDCRHFDFGYHVDYYLITRDEAMRLVVDGMPATWEAKTRLGQVPCENKRDSEIILGTSSFRFKGTSYPTTIESVDLLLKLQSEGVCMGDAEKLACWAILIAGRTARRVDYKEGTFTLMFPYSKALVDFVGSIPSAHWDKRKGMWTLRETEWTIKYLNEMSSRFFFSMSVEAAAALATTKVDGKKNGKVSISKTASGYNALFQFDYCIETIQALKELGAKWNQRNRKWSIAVNERNQDKIIDLAKKFNFAVSDKLIK